MASFDSNAFDTGSFSELAFFFGAVTEEVTGTEEVHPTNSAVRYQQQALREDEEVLILFRSFIEVIQCRR